jgi:hypothetical protein
MKKTREVYTYFLAAIFIFGYFTLIGLMFFKVIPDVMMPLAQRLFDTLTVLIVLVVKFFFDGNKETAAKNEMIFRSTPPPSGLATTETKTETTSTTEPEIKES